MTGFVVRSSLSGQEGIHRLEKGNRGRGKEEKRETARRNLSFSPFSLFPSSLFICRVRRSGIQVPCAQKSLQASRNKLLFDPERLLAQDQRFRLTQSLRRFDSPHVQPPRTLQSYPSLHNSQDSSTPVPTRDCEVE